MLKKIFLLSIALLGTLALSSCSSDDDGGVNGDFIVNGEGYKLDGDAQCQDGRSTEYYDLKASFEVTLFKDKRNLVGYHFALTTNLYQLSKLNVGDDLSNKVSVSSLRSLTNLYSEDKFDDESGKLIVKSIAQDAIVLEFVDFTFRKVNGSNAQTFVMNGTISYERI